MKRHLESVVNDESQVEKQRSKVNSDEERLIIFKNWLNEHNVIWDNVDIRSSTLYKGFSLYSTSSENLPNIQIPISLLMSNESAKTSSTFLLPTSDIFDQTDQHIDRETLILTLFLLHEREKDIQSHWYPYIQLLPQKFTTPLFHKENYVENTLVYYLTETMRQSMIDVCQLINLNKNFTLEDFLWAYTVIDSRAFKLTDLGTTLIPLADLANHVSLIQEANLYSTGIDKDISKFILKTTDKTILQDEELCLKYNELANWQLLLYYGFTIENNPFDSILIELKIDSDDSYEMEMKKIFLINLSEDLFLEHELKIPIDSEPIINENLLATLRLIVMTNDELENYNISNINQLLSTIVNINNEQRVLNKLFELINHFKDISFTITLEENLQRLQSDQLDDNERYSLIYLIGQKKIIDITCQWIDNARSQLK